MIQTLSHRGPDDAGVWMDNEYGIALGHRRLSIVDLSQAGHQPMRSSCGRYVLVFNGEIYNHLSIRDELQRSSLAFPWNGHSDTETLLSGFAAWGVKQTLGKAVGMFAFALWDKDEHRLIIGRDRFGEKPLYYGWTGAQGKEVFLFGSELKALKEYPDFDNPVDRNALALYLQYCYVPAPYSIYLKIFKLRPGCILSLDRKQLAQKQLTIEPYWKLHEAFSAGLQKPISDKEKAVKALDETLRQAVGQQMVADVPLGAFLSGGMHGRSRVILEPITTRCGYQQAKPVRLFRSCRNSTMNPLPTAHRFLPGSFAVLHGSR